MSDVLYPKKDATPLDCIPCTCPEGRETIVLGSPLIVDLLVTIIKLKQQTIAINTINKAWLEEVEPIFLYPHVTKRNFP